MQNVIVKDQYKGGNPIHPLQVRAGFDSFEKELQRPVSVAHFKRRLESLGLVTAKAYLKRRRGFTYSIACDEESSPLFHYIARYSKDGGYQVTYLITWPSRFDSAEHMFRMLDEMFGSDVVSAMVIRRIDFFLDLLLEFMKVFPGIDVLYKRNSRERGSGQLKSLLVGGKPNPIFAYDKAAKEKEVVPRTRIESRFWTKARPVKRVAELREFIHTNAHEPNFDPFKNVTLSKIEFQEGDSENSGKRENLIRFQTGVELIGYCGARKWINKKVNFHRDIKPYVTKTPILDDLKQAFWSNLRPWAISGTVVPEVVEKQAETPVEPPSEPQFDEIDECEYIGLPLFDNEIEKQIGGAHEER